MIIDAHCHIFSSNVDREKNDFCNDFGFNLLYGSGKGKIGTVARLKEYMDLENIDFVWGMGFCWEDINLCEAENEMILKECSGEKRILPFLGIPAAGNADIKRYIRHGRKEGFRGIGEITFYKDGLSIENEAYIREILYAAGEENMPVCLHMNEPLGHVYPGKYNTDFARLYAIIQDFPAVKIILAHFGGGILFYELMPEVKAAFKNVWYDTAAAPFIYDPSVYSRAAAVAGVEKILFGSDFPLLGLNRYEDGIRAYLDEDDALKLLGENAADIV